MTASVTTLHIKSSGLDEEGERVSAEGGRTERIVAGDAVKGTPGGILDLRVSLLSGPWLRSHGSCQV